MKKIMMFFLLAWMTAHAYAEPIIIDDEEASPALILDQSRNAVIGQSSNWSLQYKTKGCSLYQTCRPKPLTFHQSGSLERKEYTDLGAKTQVTSFQADQDRLIELSTTYNPTWYYNRTVSSTSMQASKWYSPVFVYTAPSTQTITLGSIEDTGYSHLDAYWYDGRLGADHAKIYMNQKLVFDTQSDFEIPYAFSLQKGDQLVVDYHDSVPLNQFPLVASNDSKKTVIGHIQGKVVIPAYQQNNQTICIRWNPKTNTNEPIFDRKKAFESSDQFDPTNVIGKGIGEWGEPWSDTCSNWAGWNGIEVQVSKQTEEVAVTGFQEASLYYQPDAMPQSPSGSYIGAETVKEERTVRCDLSMGSRFTISPSKRLCSPEGKPVIQRSNSFQPAVWIQLVIQSMKKLSLK